MVVGLVDDDDDDVFVFFILVVLLFECLLLSTDLVHTVRTQYSEVVVVVV